MVSVEESEKLGELLNALEFVNNTYVKDTYAKERIKKLITKFDEFVV